PRKLRRHPRLADKRQIVERHIHRLDRGKRAFERNGDGGEVVHLEGLRIDEEVVGQSRRQKAESRNEHEPNAPSAFCFPLSAFHHPTLPSAAALAFIRRSSSCSCCWTL